MGKNSGIQWCTASHGFWYGCRRVSPGCAYCYADRDMKWKGKVFNTVTRAKGFDAPLKRKDPQRIFVNPWSDFFIEEADEWRDDAMGVIRATDHIYMILTKRVERANFERYRDWPWPNVWLGVSVENQRQADERIPKLLQIAAAKSFVSIEPLLGPIDFNHIQNAESGAALDWVIVGGESGGPEYRRLVAKVCCCGDWKEAHDEKGHCRTCRASRGPLCMKYRFSHWEEKPEAFQWVRSLRDQCQAAGVPFFFKQWGGPRPDSAGSILDGQEHKQLPV